MKNKIIPKEAESTTIVTFPLDFLTKNMIVYVHI